MSESLTHDPHTLAPVEKYWPWVQASTAPYDCPAGINTLNVVELLFDNVFNGTEEKCSVKLPDYWLFIEVW